MGKKGGTNPVYHKEILAHIHLSKKRQELRKRKGLGEKKKRAKSRPGS